MKLMQQSFAQRLITTVKVVLILLNIVQMRPSWAWSFKRNADEKRVKCKVYMTLNSHTQAGQAIF